MALLFRHLTIPRVFPVAIVNPILLDLGGHTSRLRGQWDNEARPSYVSELIPIWRAERHQQWFSYHDVLKAKPPSSDVKWKPPSSDVKWKPPSSDVKWNKAFNGKKRKKWNKSFQQFSVESFIYFHIRWRWLDLRNIMIAKSLLVY